MDLKPATEWACSILSELETPITAESSDFDTKQFLRDALIALVIAHSERGAHLSLHQIIGALYKSEHRQAALSSGDDAPYATFIQAAVTALPQSRTSDVRQIEKAVAQIVLFNPSNDLLNKLAAELSKWAGKVDLERLTAVLAGQTEDPLDNASTPHPSRPSPTVDHDMNATAASGLSKWTSLASWKSMLSRRKAEPKRPATSPLLDQRGFANQPDPTGSFKKQKRDAATPRTTPNIWETTFARWDNEIADPAKRERYKRCMVQMLAQKDLEKATWLAGRQGFPDHPFGKA